MVEELDLLTRQLEQIEDAMASALSQLDYADLILGIQGIGVVTAAVYWVKLAIC